MNKRICPYCGGEIPADSTFCSICGAKIEKPNTWDAGRDMNLRRCPNCGNEIIAGDQFCAFCGARVPLNAGQSAGQQTSNGQSGGQQAVGPNTQGCNNGSGANYMYGVNSSAVFTVQDRKQIKSRAQSLLNMSYGQSILVSLVQMIVLPAIAGLIGYLSLPASLLPALFMPAWAGSILISGLVAGIIAAFCFTFFLWLPIDVGCRRFFVINHFAPGKTSASEMFYSFRNNQYIRVFKIMFLYEIKIILWSLLLIVPGVVKAYSWRLAPYLAAERPDLSAKEVLNLSKSMMDGKKKDAFIFDLSFIGWYLLACVPLVGLLYVYPYKASADAGLYIWIRDRSQGTGRMNRNQTGYWNY